MYHRYIKGQEVHYTDVNDEVRTGLVEVCYEKHGRPWYTVQVSPGGTPAFYEVSEVNILEAETKAKAQELEAKGPVDEARENLTSSLMELLNSLQDAIVQAGGAPQVLDPKMTIGELFTILAPNRIRFVHRGGPRR